METSYNNEFSPKNFKEILAQKELMENELKEINSTLNKPKEKCVIKHMMYLEIIDKIEFRDLLLEVRYKNENSFNNDFNYTVNHYLEKFLALIKKDPICSTTIEGLDEEYEVIEAELRELAAIKIEKLHLNHIKEYEVFKIKESKLSEIYDLKMKEAEALKKEYQDKIDKLTIDELKSKLKKQKTFFQRVFNK